MGRNIKKRKTKKAKPIAAILLLILILLAILIYFKSSNKEVETSAQPMNQEELVEENNAIEETVENVIDKNTETNEQDNNVTNKTTNTNANTKNNTIPYYIKVNYGAQVVTIYGKDSNGDYTVPVKAMVCSTGTATPKSGVYSIPGRWTWGTLFGNVYGQYCIKITGNILFHSVPYFRKGDPASLEYWEYDKLGTAASAGCVRLKVADVIWLYNNCGNGTKVEFYSSSDPGPLGKPSSKKISSYPDYLRNWDPTDPNPNNPWRDYKENGNTNNKQNETRNNTKPDDSAKKEETNSAKPDNSVENEITNSDKPDSSEKNDKTNTSAQNNMVSNNNNEKQNNVVKN